MHVSGGSRLGCRRRDMGRLASRFYFQTWSPTFSVSAGTRHRGAGSGLRGQAVGGDGKVSGRLPPKQKQTNRRWTQIHADQEARRRWARHVLRRFYSSRRRRGTKIVFAVPLWGIDKFREDFVSPLFFAPLRLCVRFFFGVGGRLRSRRYQHNLAHMFALLHSFVGLGSLGKGEHAIDQGAEMRAAC
jgi:hypothetical protein